MKQVGPQDNIKPRERLQGIETLHPPSLHDPPPSTLAAPAGLGSAEDGRNFQSWYRPRPGTSVGTYASILRAIADGGSTFAPMSPGPVVVQPSHVWRFNGGIEGFFRRLNLNLDEANGLTVLHEFGEWVYVQCTPPSFSPQQPTQQGPGPFIVFPVPKATIIGPVDPPHMIGGRYPLS
ncbi:hypothetical protein BJ138DRAFT_1112869 [Hygrophoropsis aurantiaca]|uniref:Uncharacterized protein n=1 Tax=Hygrophoropsis aurantiaca TaxID=72124 RepID=A0ACB8AFR3_9AGAM|nr:hypothetical protein BJ138DRAFT_1112869 [Hygrophoropsis aurantiaca]